MIQRLQSLFLLLVAVMASLLLFGGWEFYIAEGEKNAMLTFTSTSISGVKMSDSLSQIIIALLVLISFGAIFLYKNRTMQRSACWVLMGGIVLIWIIAFMRYTNVSSQLAAQNSAQGSINIVFLFPLLMLVLTLLALRGIWKDDQLVKSMDRLR